MKRPNYRKVLLTIVGIVVTYTALVIILLKVEQNAPGTKITNIRDSLWYLLETLTTVGYGDKLPVTDEGTIIGFIFLISSLGVYGFIIGQFANFMSTLKEQKELGLNGTTFKNHVVIVGWNDFSQAVISHLIGAGRQVAIITKDRPSVDIIREYYTHDQVYILYSDYNNFDLLEKSNLKQASIIFINLNDDTEKLVYVINMKKHFEGLNYVVSLDNGNLKNTFESAGVTYAISKNEISSKLLASYIYEPDVARFSEEIIAFAHEEDDYDMKQFRITGHNPLIGMFYEKVFFDLKKQCNVVLIGLVKIENGKRKMYRNPEDSMKVEDGDYLIMLMDGKGQDRLKKVFHIEEGLSI
ncbi:MAG TPA: potassium channel family protein [Cyclobacteriaceae bacterium]